MGQLHVSVSQLLGVLSVLCVGADARVHAAAGYVRPIRPRQHKQHIKKHNELLCEAARISSQGVSTTHPCMLSSNPFVMSACYVSAIACTRL